MKTKTMIKLGIASTLLLSSISFAAERKSFGLGIGPVYNGVGVSYGIQSQNTFKYLSLGCISISKSSVNGTNYNCGGGVGFISTDFFEIEGNKHGFGAHAGATYNEKYSELDYFVTPQYTYFFNGIDKPGWNVGVNVSLGHFSGETEANPGIQLGYQF